MLKFISSIGRRGIRVYFTISNIIIFIASTIRLALVPSSYDRATTRVLIRQIYFTSSQILLYFITLSFFFGATLVGLSTGVLKSMNLLASLGESFFGFVIIEIAPMFTVILLALRSSSAISTEIAMMSANNEMEALRVFGINPTRYIALPRIIAGALSVVLLSFLFATIAIAGGGVSSFLFFGTSVKGYMYLLVNNMLVSDFIYLLAKSLLLGIVAVMIPIYTAMHKLKNITMVPVAVSVGMVRLFDAIILIEVVTLTLRFL